MSAVPISDQVDGAVSALRALLASAQEQIDALEAENDELQADLEGSCPDCASLEDEVSGYADRVAGLEAEFGQHGAVEYRAKFLREMADWPELESVRDFLETEAWIKRRL